MTFWTIATYVGYAATAIRHFRRIAAWLKEGVAIANDFGIKFPHEEKKPGVSDVIGALTESSSGRISFTPKKVRDWSPEEWKNFWNRGATPPG